MQRPPLPSLSGRHRRTLSDYSPLPVREDTTEEHERSLPVSTSPPRHSQPRASAPASPSLPGVVEAFEEEKDDFDVDTLPDFFVDSDSRVLRSLRLPPDLSSAVLLLTVSIFLGAPALVRRSPAVADAFASWRSHSPSVLKLHHWRRAVGRVGGAGVARTPRAHKTLCRSLAAPGPFAKPGEYLNVGAILSPKPRRCAASRESEALRRCDARGHARLTPPPRRRLRARPAAAFHGPRVGRQQRGGRECDWAPLCVRLCFAGAPSSFGRNVLHNAGQRHVHQRAGVERGALKPCFRVAVVARNV